jgi:hypothetical protein
MKLLRSILLPVIAVALTSGTLWYTNRSLPPQRATWEDVFAEAKKGDYNIINNKELWELYRANPSNLLLVDTRQEWEYRAGHIKGALNFSMEPTWWARWRAKGALAKFLGPDKQRTIVFY